MSAISFLLSSTAVSLLLLLFHPLSAFTWSGVLPFLLPPPQSLPSRATINNTWHFIGPRKERERHHVACTRPPLTKLGELKTISARECERHTCCGYSPSVFSSCCGSALCPGPMKSPPEARRERTSVLEGPHGDTPRKAACRPPGERVRGVSHTYPPSRTSAPCLLTVGGVREIVHEVPTG